MVSARSHNLVLLSLGRLCGTFALNGRFFHVALSNLAFSVGAPYVNEWYIDKSGLDETFARAFRVVLKDYDTVDQLDKAISSVPIGLLSSM